MQVKKIAIFASGNGSNALNIIRFFENNTTIEVSCIFCNNPKAKVLQKAKNKNVATFLFDKKSLIETDIVLEKLLALDIDLIVLAGFLLKIPKKIISTFSNKIINIHPSLLPKYGGKGMYGNHVHRAVLQDNEKVSGISIHYVNAKYDDGQILAQFKTNIDNNETLESLKQKIHELEQKHFPEIIYSILKDEKD